ncbi:hypothetical protein [Psittacicella hinzii]|nr:hypothetical protein [Psittacicella hinzii]
MFALSRVTFAPAIEVFSVPVIFVPFKLTSSVAETVALPLVSVMFEFEPFTAPLVALTSASLPVTLVLSKVTLLPLIDVFSVPVTFVPFKFTSSVAVTVALPLVAVILVLLAFTEPLVALTTDS